jgi:hypothetical protein
MIIHTNEHMLTKMPDQMMTIFYVIDLFKCLIYLISLGSLLQMDSSLPKSHTAGCNAIDF